MWQKQLLQVIFLYTGPEAKEEKVGSASGDVIQRGELDHEIHEHKMLSFWKALTPTPTIPLP